jgi:hypothetical protein
MLRVRRITSRPLRLRRDVIVSILMWGYIDVGRGSNRMPLIIGSVVLRCCIVISGLWPSVWLLLTGPSVKALCAGWTTGYIRVY